MIEIVAADAAGGVHGVGLRQCYAGGFGGIEQVEERRFLGMIRAGGIAGGGADAAVLLSQVSVRNRAMQEHTWLIDKVLLEIVSVHYLCITSPCRVHPPSPLVR